MSSILSWFSRNNKKVMGTELATKDGVKAHIEKLEGDVKKTSRVVQSNLEKYKEIKKLNEAMTKSYVQNLVVFRDVSEMLQSCLGVFQSLEQEFSKLEEATGKELKTTDFDYLTNMTQSKIDSLNTELNKQAEMLKKVYTMHGRPEELNRIILAQSNRNKLVSDATTTYKKVADKKQKTEGNSNVFDGNSSIEEAETNTKVTPEATETQEGGSKKRRPRKPNPTKKSKQVKSKK